ncbi:MAG: universal stress protein [Bacteroidales bacterium]|nr:universal stress protein [Bacteroidales bacterium]
MKESILVPTDFSEVCNNAMNHACDLAKDLNLKVIALHVVTKETKTYLDDQKLSNEALEKRLSDYVNGKKAEFEVDTDYVLREGSIFDEISNISKEMKSAFVVLGTHGKVGFQRLTGSYALKVINNTEIPTVVVQKKPQEGSYKNIVFPISAFAEDRQKLNVAMAIAKAFGATIHLFPKFETDKFARKKILGIVKQVLQIFEENGIDYCKTLPDESAGNYSKQVVDYAVVHDADLIMIVTGSNTTLPMFDSADEQIIFNSSQIPAMCINPARVKRVSFGGSSWSGF